MSVPGRSCTRFCYVYKASMAIRLSFNAKCCKMDTKSHRRRKELPMQAYYWLILFAILLAVEIFTLGLTTIWFAGGALVAFFAALAGANLYVQLILWLVVSVLLLVCTRPVAKKYICKKQEKTNVDSLVGQETVVCEDISNRENTGKVMINGIEWTARAEDPTAMYEKGSIVRILRIEGVKVIVKKGE